MTEEEMEKKFEAWFEEEAYLLQFSLVPPKSEIDKVVREWMLEAYLQGHRDEAKERQKEIEGLKSHAIDLGKKLFDVVDEKLELEKEIIGGGGN